MLGTPAAAESTTSDATSALGSLALVASAKGEVRVPGKASVRLTLGNITQHLHQ